MKKTLLALSLIICVLLTVVSCTDDPYDVDVSGTSRPPQGQVVTTPEGNLVTTPNGDVVTQSSTFEILGVNTDSGWGPVRRP